MAAQLISFVLLDRIAELIFKLLKEIEEKNFPYPFGPESSRQFRSH